MRQKVIKTGHSAAVTITASFARMVGVKIGDTVHVETRPETGRVILRFQGAYQLLLARDILRRTSVIKKPARAKSPPLPKNRKK